MGARPLEVRRKEAEQALYVAEARLHQAQERYDKAKAKCDKLKNGSTIRERIQIVRSEKGLSYKDLAQKMGMSRQAVEECINKYAHSPKRLVQIADALGVSVDFLITGRCDNAEV